MLKRYKEIILGVLQAMVGKLWKQLKRYEQLKIRLKSKRPESVESRIEERATIVMRIEG
jgi:hypothetical protein